MSFGTETVTAKDVCVGDLLDLDASHEMWGHGTGVHPVKGIRLVAGRVVFDVARSNIACDRDCPVVRVVRP